MEVDQARRITETDGGGGGGGGGGGRHTTDDLKERYYVPYSLFRCNKAPWVVLTHTHLTTHSSDLWY